MEIKLPDVAIASIIESLRYGKLIQKQARLCDLAALDAIPSEIIPWLSLPVQKAIASQSMTSERIFAQLAKSPFRTIKLTLACNPNISASIIVILGAEIENDLELAGLIWQNPHITADIKQKIRGCYVYRRAGRLSKIIASSYAKTESPLYLEKLSESEDPQLRDRAARNPATPAYILEKLAEDPSEVVRCGVASNRNAPASVLELVFSPTRIVENLKTIKTRYNDNSIISALTLNPSTHFIIRKFYRSNVKLSRLNVTWFAIAFLSWAIAILQNSL